MVQFGRRRRSGTSRHHLRTRRHLWPTCESLSAPRLRRRGVDVVAGSALRRIVLLTLVTRELFAGSAPRPCSVGARKPRGEHIITTSMQVESFSGVSLEPFGPRVGERGQGLGEAARWRALLEQNSRAGDQAAGAALRRGRERATPTTLRAYHRPRPPSACHQLDTYTRLSRGGPCDTSAYFRNGLSHPGITTELHRSSGRTP